MFFGCRVERRRDGYGVVGLSRWTHGSITGESNSVPPALGARNVFDVTQRRERRWFHDAKKCSRGGAKTSKHLAAGHH